MFLDFMSGVDPRMLTALSGLCSVEGDPPPGGGGGGGNAPETGFTQAQLDYLTVFENKLITQLNSGMTSRDKRFEKQFGEKLDAIVTKLAEAKAPADPDDPPGKGKGGKSAHDDVALQTMQRRLEEMEQRASAADAQARAERAKNRDIERKRILGELLSGIGITDPVRVRHAIAFLDSEGRVAYEDEDSERIVWREGASQVDLPVGLRTWARTDDAKHFISPAAPRGSGSTPGQKGGGGGAALTLEQRIARVDDLIRQNF